MSYRIKVRTFLWFWETYKVKRHWFEMQLSGQAIPPRMCIETTKGDIVVIANILLRDWRLYGISSSASKRTRPTNEISGTTSEPREPVFFADDAAGRSVSQPSAPIAPAGGDCSREPSSSEHSEEGGVDSGAGRFIESLFTGGANRAGDAIKF
jgi:hypothetical protein